MRSFWAKCAYILILQFVLVAAGSANTLTVDEAGNVLAETDNYRVRFEHGVITAFYNKLTQENYTRGNAAGYTSIRQFGGRKLETKGNLSEIKIPSPLECELIYIDNWRSKPQDNQATLHLYISIDTETNDLLIKQKGTLKMGGIGNIAWGFSNLSEEVVDTIVPVKGGQILTPSSIVAERVRYQYPGKWEAQLAILQGQHGGVFIRSDDDQYRFKLLEYIPQGKDFAINFWEIPHVPFEDVKEIAIATWRINAYEGDWQVPATIYREWMHNSLKPANREEMPAWVNDIELVITHADPLESVGTSVIDILSRYVDPEKTLLYVTGWRKAGWRWNYPDYTPTDNFGEFLQKAHSYGFKVMLHVNMLAVSPANPFYEKIKKHQITSPITGEIVGAHLDSPDPLRGYVSINTASEDFRNLLINRLKNVWETYNIDAFHLDLSFSVDNVYSIKGMRMAEGNILLHQELREAMPGIALGGELINDVTFLHESFAQQLLIGLTEQPHPISSFLFSPYTRFYGHLGFPNPDRDPVRYQEYVHAYRIWEVIPTLRLDGVSDLDSELTETYEILELARKRQNWVFGDVNSDGVVNILDLTLVAQNFGVEKPNNPKVDVNKDGVVNILDLTIVAQQIG